MQNVQVLCCENVVSEDLLLPLWTNNAFWQVFDPKWEYVKENKIPYSLLQQDAQKPVERDATLNCIALAQGS